MIEQQRHPTGSSSTHFSTRHFVFFILRASRIHVNASNSWFMKSWNKYEYIFWHETHAGWEIVCVGVACYVTKCCIYFWIRISNVIKSEIDTILGHRISLRTQTIKAKEYSRCRRRKRVCSLSTWCTSNLLTCGHTTPNNSPNFMRS